ncbi:hypothetical protein DSAG12_04210 [Promethearchaeum syntrophicum]|uniref:Uncharacterized protein n=1 Tax=Promethearchaeum syntrophicum TaxID=2594042 RepID=A0AC61ZTZ9_9ARCH
MSKKSNRLPPVFSIVTTMCIKSSLKIRVLSSVRVTFSSSIFCDDSKAGRLMNVENRKNTPIMIMYQFLKPNPEVRKNVPITTSERPFPPNILFFLLKSF